MGTAGLSSGRGWVLETPIAGKGQLGSHTLQWILGSPHFLTLVSAMCNCVLAPLGKYFWFLNNFPIYSSPL